MGRKTTGKFVFYRNLINSSRFSPVRFLLLRTILLPEERKDVRSERKRKRKKYLLFPSLFLPSQFCPFSFLSSIFLLPPNLPPSLFLFHTNQRAVWFSGSTLGSQPTESGFDSWPEWKNGKKLGVHLVVSRYATSGKEF